MTAPLTVHIPTTPHKALRPNTDAHSWTRKPFIQDARAAAKLAAGGVLRGRTWRHEGPIRIGIKIAWGKDLRGQTLDWQNALSSTKAHVDGVFDRLEADDKQVTGFDLIQLQDPDGQGWMEITVIPIKEEQAA